MIVEERRLAASAPLPRRDAIALIERATALASSRGAFTLGSDDGSAFTAGGFRAHLPGLARHRGCGHRDPEGSIESWFVNSKNATYGGLDETLHESLRGIDG